MHGLVVMRVDILLAEDDLEVRRFLAQALRSDGFRITEAVSGTQLMDRLWERAASKAGFDLIISDVRMPGFTGFEVLEMLREQPDPSDDFEPQVREVPIILITAFGDPGLHAAATRLGAVVLDKPFDIDDLRACAHRLLTSDDERHRDVGGRD